MLTICRVPEIWCTTDGRKKWHIEVGATPKNTITWTFSNKLFSTLNPDTFAHNIEKLSQTNSTDLWNCLFTKFSVLKLEVLVSTKSKNYGNILIFVKRLRATYIRPWLNEFCFSKLKMMTTEFKLKPCLLWTLHVHDNTSGWVKMITDVIFNFRMSFCLLNTECFIFPGISEDKGSATMVLVWKEFCKVKSTTIIYDMFWNAYGVDTNLPAHENRGFHFHLVSMHGLKSTFMHIIFVLILVHSNPFETVFMRQATNLKLT